MQTTPLTCPKLQMPVLGIAKKQQPSQFSILKTCGQTLNIPCVLGMANSQNKHAPKQSMLCKLLNILLSHRSSDVVLDVELEVDQCLQLGECIHCISLHTSCILEEFNGSALLNVLSFDQLTQEWFYLPIKG